MPNAASHAPVHIGRYVPSPGGEGGSAGLRFLCDAPELAAHADTPWLRAWAAERLDIPLSSLHGNRSPVGKALVSHDLLARHACVCGATGSGKTRLALRLLEGQINAGCSVVMLDPKAETIRHLMQLCFAAGLEPGQVTVLSPFLAGTGAPGWNPLDCNPVDGQASGVTPVQAAADVVSVLEKSTSSWGPRMGDLLTNALIVIASHGLSLFELARLLQREDYRQALLHTPLPDRRSENGRSDRRNGREAGPLDAVAYEEARDYFLCEFDAWSKSERAAATAPVLNKFRELLRSPFLRSLLCARRNTLHLSSLWHKQGVVLVHLDAASLGDEGVRMLGGLLAHQLLRTAMRAEGPVPVVLALDEMGVSEEFVGGAAAKILAIARSRGLRLLVACQHLSQLSEGLRSALLSNAAVQAFFRLGYADARLAAAAMSAGTGERVAKVAADVAKRDAAGEPEAWVTMRHTVRDGRGEPIALSPAASAAFRDMLRSGNTLRAGKWGDDGAAQVEGLLRLARVSGEGRLYVHAADTKAPVELRRYVRGLSPEEYWLEVSGGRSEACGSKGMAPVTLAISFPRPRLSVISKETESERERAWTRELTGLAVRRAALRLGGGAACVVEVATVADPRPLPGLDRFVSAAVASGGQSSREIAAAQEWRREQVERLALKPKMLGDNQAGLDDADADGDGQDSVEPVQATRQVRPSPGNRPPRRKTSGRSPSRSGVTVAASRPSLPAAPVGTVAEDGSLA